MVRIAPRFQKGDLIEIPKYIEPEDDSIRSGLVLIEEVVPFEGTKYWIYVTNVIKGNLCMLKYNSFYFDKLNYLVWLGNIYENESLRLLYAPRVNND